MSDHVTLREIVTNLLYPAAGACCAGRCAAGRNCCVRAARSNSRRQGNFSGSRRYSAAGEYYGAPGMRGPFAPGWSS